MAFGSREFFPGVVHIRDAMGVCFTLLRGAERALLIDTGYGLEPVERQIAALTDLPYRVLLTHGHHDHALGAACFSRVWLRAEDLPVYRKYTSPQQRRLVLAQAAARGIPVDTQAYLDRPLPEPEPMDDSLYDLGGLHVQPLPCPGHTPGSVMFYVPEHGLLLTGDNWNPCTWLFFPEALDVLSYAANLRQCLARLPYSRVLCSHSFELHPRAELEAFLAGLTPACLTQAEASDEGTSRGIRTAACAPAAGQRLVFDYDRYLRAVSGGMTDEGS